MEPVRRRSNFAPAFTPLPRRLLVYFCSGAYTALRASKARVFVLTAGNLRGFEIAAVFVGALPGILKVLHTVAGPFVARVSQSGLITMT